MARASAILKAEQARALSPGLAFNFDDLRLQAEAHLAAARTEAAALLESARREAEAVLRQAQQQGWESGRQEGLRDAAQTIATQAEQLAQQRLQERLQTVIPALNQAAQLLRAERDRWLARWETAALELSLAIARKLICAELTARPELVKGMISQALELAIGQAHVRLFLHPDDRRCLGESAEQVVQALTAGATVELVDDATLQRGDCRIETRQGEIDARLETMLQRLAEELLMGG